jgi:hypothetical protein
MTERLKLNFRGNVLKSDFLTEKISLGLLDFLIVNPTEAMPLKYLVQAGPTIGLNLVPRGQLTV